MKADAPALVAITRAEDLHADLVLAKVDMLDIPYLRIDVPALADAVAMSVYELGRTRVKLESDAVSADLSRVRTIWWRKPTITSLAPDHVTEWIDLERRHAAYGLLNTLNVEWVNPLPAMRTAGYKARQLALCGSFGLHPPDTVITTSADVAQEFIRTHTEGVVVKTLSVPAIYDKRRAATIYTHLIVDDDLAHLHHIVNCPTLLQAFVPKRYDIRVIVIDKTVLAFRIGPTSDERSRADIRNSGFFGIPHEVFDLGSEVAAACRNFVSCLGLRFGALDFVLDHENELWFLEVNPNGQWLWLEMLTGVSISDHIVDALVGVP